MNKYKYIVTENKLLTPTVRSLTLLSESTRKPMLFEPGQYAAISLHDRLRPTTTRCFSIASSPTNRSALEFVVRVGGEYTQALERLTYGDAVVVRGPFGDFVLPERMHQSLVFLAGGIGITPFMSMIRYASELQLKSDIHLIFSCKNQDDIPFFEELIRLEQKNPHLRVTFVVADKKVDRLQGHEVVSGRLDASVLQKIGLPRTSTYMVCGPSGYIQAMHGLLAHHGVHSTRILSETFNQGSHQGSRRQTRWPEHMFALSGLSLMLAGSLIVSGDLIKTLPELEASYEPVAAVSSSRDSEGGSKTAIVDVSAIPPQVDTTLTQEPVIKHIASTEKVVTIPSAVAPAPIPASVVAPSAPQVVASPSVPVVKQNSSAPTRTVKPKSPPKTRVS